MLTAVCQAVGLPIDAIVLLLSVDRVADMIRTTINVTGDAVVSLVVARMEGEFDERIFDAKNI
jgi:Na+/H+-dicarboxylate symporter